MAVELFAKAFASLPRELADEDTALASSPPPHSLSLALLTHSENIAVAEYRSRYPLNYVTDE